jgi:hypothetical protein
MSSPLRLADHLNHLGSKPTPKESQMRFATGRQALMASRLNGKPATRKHGKPTRG